MVATAKQINAHARPVVVEPFDHWRGPATVDLAIRTYLAALRTRNRWKQAKVAEQIFTRFALHRRQRVKRVWYLELCPGYFERYVDACPRVIRQVYAEVLKVLGVQTVDRETAFVAGCSIRRLKAGQMHGRHHTISDGALRAVRSWARREGHYTPIQSDEPPDFDDPRRVWHRVDVRHPYRPSSRCRCPYCNEGMMALDALQKRASCMEGWCMARALYDPSRQAVAKHPRDPTARPLYIGSYPPKGIPQGECPPGDTRPKHWVTQRRESPPPEKSRQKSSKEPEEGSSDWYDARDKRLRRARRPAWHDRAWAVERSWGDWGGKPSPWPRCPEFDREMGWEPDRDRGG